MEKARQTAIEIISIFEDLLEENNLTIPDRDREGEPEEARIYGITYYSLEDEITELLRGEKQNKTENNLKIKEYIKQIDKKENRAIQTDELLKNFNFSEKEINKIVYKLLEDGFIFEPKPDYLRWLG